MLTYTHCTLSSRRLANNFSLKFYIGEVCIHIGGYRVTCVLRGTKGIKMGGKQNFRVKIRVVFSPLTLAFIRNGKIPDNKRIRIGNKNFLNKAVLD